MVEDTLAIKSSSLIFEIYTDGTKTPFEAIISVLHKMNLNNNLVN